MRILVTWHNSSCDSADVSVVPNMPDADLWWRDPTLTIQGHHYHATERSLSLKLLTQAT